MNTQRRAATWLLAATIACAASPSFAQTKPIAAPSNYIPQSAVAYGQPGQPATPVTPTTPMPVTCITGCNATGAGVATAAAPARTEGQSSGLSFDLSGALRITGAGGGGGGPTSIADGADQALGAKADAAWAGSGNGSSIAILKAIRNLLASPLAVTGTFWQATQPVSAVSLPLPAGAATAPNQATANASLASIDTRMADGQMTAGSVKAGRAVIVDAAGAPLNWTDPVPVTQSAGPWTTRPTATSSGGCTPYGYQSAASVNATLVATGARTLCSLSVINTTASLYYLRIYDIAAAPTCSNATGFIRTVPIPAGTSGAGVALPIGAFGEAYAAGLGFCITGGPSNTDNTNAAVGVFVVGSYK